MSDKDFYYKVVNDWSTLPECLDYFMKEAERARLELSLKGRLEEHAHKMPVIVEFRFSQLQVIDSILRYFELELKKTRSKYYKKYLENYNKMLSARDAEKYVDGEKEVADLELLINEIAMVRNIFTGITKGLENKSFQINNITKLRASGLDDATID